MLLRSASRFSAASRPVKTAKSWCAREDLNLHSFRNRILSPARLPFRHARMSSRSSMLAISPASVTAETAAMPQRRAVLAPAAPMQKRCFSPRR